MATINTTCPVCSTPHAKKLSVIYQEGLSTIQTDINTVSTFNTLGRQKFKTKGTANGTQQTQASKDAAPPVVPKLVTTGMWIQGMLIALGIVMCVGGMINSATVVAIFGIVVIVGSFAVPVKPTEIEQRDYDERTKHLRAAKEAWADTFMCGSCGHKFVPSTIQTA
ncbi:hypothetical protein [Massilia sp. CT11-137]|uniref:hypothetical protein n=1 Tax=Massilia sp. CT11-137 TaxID=3393901 RepID=UPI0039A44A11